MKKVNLIPVVLLTVASMLTSCGNDEFTIRVGASPTPHAAILNTEAVVNYVESKGYKLDVIIYHDYVTPNKALNDGGIDANYFQHTPYLLEEVATKGYDIAPACEVHFEMLNLYSKNPIFDFSGKTISIINDVSNVERALALLKSNKLIADYNMEGFNPSKPNDYVSGSIVELECLDPGLLVNKVNDDGIAIIPGNYALTAWGVSKCINYSILQEDYEEASKKANIVAVRKENLNSPKTNVLCEALAQVEVRDYIIANYHPTVLYKYEDCRVEE